MVSSSVAGLPPGNVTVVDQAGRLLTQSDGTGRDLNASQLKYANEVENGFQRRIEAISPRWSAAPTCARRSRRRSTSPLANKPMNSTNLTNSLTKPLSALSKPV